MAETLMAPFPYFGGKRLASEEVWRRFGEVGTYIEPFAGSLAVLLQNPAGPADREIVNDLDGLIANFWRALKGDWAAVAYYADHPTSQVDLTARKGYCVRRYPELTAALEADPEYYDVKAAGYWLYCVSADIGRFQNREVNNGSGKTSMPIVTPVPGGHGVMVQRTGGVPWGHCKPPGRWVQGIEQGIPPLDGRRLQNLLLPLAERLAKVYILCKDWSGLFSPTVLGQTASWKNVTGIFLDPPYGTTVRSRSYAVDSWELGPAVKEKAIELGSNPLNRVALCGYKADYAGFPVGWECWEWTALGGMHHGKNPEYGQEVIWFSPHCLPAQQASLF